VEALQVAPERLVAWLGPAIGPEHFEVGAEVREALVKGDLGSRGGPLCRMHAGVHGGFERSGSSAPCSPGSQPHYGGGHCTYAEQDRTSRIDATG